MLYFSYKYVILYVLFCPQPVSSKVYPPSVHPSVRQSVRPTVWKSETCDNSESIKATQLKLHSWIDTN